MARHAYHHRQDGRISPDEVDVGVTMGTMQAAVAAQFEPPTDGTSDVLGTAHGVLPMLSSSATGAVGVAPRKERKSGRRKSTDGGRTIDPAARVAVTRENIHGEAEAKPRDGRRVDSPHDAIRMLRVSEDQEFEATEKGFLRIVPTRANQIKNLERIIAANPKGPKAGIYRTQLKALKENEQHAKG